MGLDWSTHTIYYQKINSIILLPPIHNSIGGNGNVNRLTRPVGIDQRHICI